MASAIETAVSVATSKFENGDLDADQYLSVISGLQQMETAPAATPVKETKAPASAQNDPSRRVYVKASVSDNFEYGHITLKKGGRRFGIWAEDVENVMDQLAAAYDDLPQSVRETAEALNSARQNIA